MIEFLSDIPLLSLFIRFMVASTVMLGAVFALDRLVLNRYPDLAALAWKLAIGGSFVALLPFGDWISNSITIENSRAAAIVRHVDDGLPITRLGTEAAPTLVINGHITAETDPAPAAAVPDISRPEADSEETFIQGNIVADVEPAFISGRDLMAFGWSLVALLGLGLLLLAYRVAIRNLGSRIRVGAEHPANQTLRLLCERADIRHVPYLSRSGAIKSPVCLPGREICLPEWAFDDLPEAEMQSLLAHELGHVVGRDPHMLLVLQVLTRTFFFQPLFALARKRLADIAELRADEWAATLIANPRAVATALFSCATKIQENRTIQWGFAMAGNSSMLKKRVERLIGAEGGAFRRTSVAAKALLVVGMTGLTLGVPGIQFADAMVAIDRDDQKAVREETRERAREQAFSERELQKFEALTEALAEQKQFLSEKDFEEVRKLQATLATKRAFLTEDDFAEIQKLQETLARNMESVAMAGEEVAAAREAAMASAATSFAYASAGDHPSISIHEDDEGHKSGNMSWNDGDRKIHVRWDGDFRLSDDDRSIVSMDEGGEFTLRTKIDGVRRDLTIENDKGKLSYAYRVAKRNTEFDDDGKAWLGDMMVMLVRQSGMNAEDRVARILKKDGAKGVIKEIKTIESSWVRSRYIQLLVTSTDLKKGELDDVIDLAAELDSDYEMRLALTAILMEEKLDKKVITKVLAAAKRIDSDYEKRMLLMPYLERFPLDGKAIDLLLEVAATIDSDYETRVLLTSALHEKSLDAKQLEKLAKIARDHIDSDYEMRLLLSVFVQSLKKSEDATDIVLDTLKRMDSDYEKRLSLAMVIEYAAMNEASWLKSIDAARSIDSDYEKTQVLLQIATRMPESDKLKDALRAAVRTVDSDYHRSQLEHVAPVRPVQAPEEPAKVKPASLKTPNKLLQSIAV